MLDLITTTNGHRKDIFNHLFDLAFVPTTVNRTNNLFKINMMDKKDKYEVNVAVPGLTKDQIKIEVKNGLLEISSNVIEKENEENSDTYLIREFSKQFFKRSFYLPKDCKDSEIEANLKDGVLTINIKKQLPDVKKIDIT